MAEQTKGLCKYCGKEYTKGGMLRHLPACKKRKEKLESEKGKRKCSYFQIVIMAKYSKKYWLIIEVGDKDIFWGTPARHMNYRLRDVVKVGDNISYEYDFGSTTELILNVHSYREGVRTADEVVILSRNNPIEIICSQCGKNKAKWVNPEAYYDEKPFWCEECLKEEAGMEDICGIEYMLPVCNSPRMGVCGYEGSTRYPDQFEPDK